MRTSLSSETKKVAKRIGIKPQYLKSYAQEWLKDTKREKLSFRLKDCLFTIMFHSRSDIEVTHVPSEATI